MFLTSDGNVYGFGWNLFNQVNSSGGTVKTPTKITETNFVPQLASNEYIIQIACGNVHTMFLTSKGNVYGCGWNIFNQVNSGGDRVYTPTKITDFPQLLSSDKIIQIACGGNHTMFLTSKGKVYGCGNNEFYQVNSINGGYWNSKIQTPKEITDFPTLETDDYITQIACGGLHTMFLTSNGNVYGCGKNVTYQVNSSGGTVKTPTKITETNFVPQLASNEYITQIDCGGNHTMFLTSNGNVYGCGYNSYYQVNSTRVADYNRIYVVKTPTKITETNFLPQLVNDKITQIACGFDHTMFLTSEGNVYGCGANYYYQVNSSGGTVNTPTKITETNFEPQLDSGDKITQISCGGNHTMFLTSEGNVYGCGNNENNQVSKIDDYYNVIDKKRIDDFNIENKPTFFASNVRKILEDND